jgi:hypothetical protein
MAEGVGVAKEEEEEEEEVVVVGTSRICKSAAHTSAAVPPLPTSCSGLQGSYCSELDLNIRHEGLMSRRDKRLSCGPLTLGA